MTARPDASDPRVAGWRDEQRDRLTRQARAKSDALPPSTATEEQLNHLAATFSGLVGRIVIVWRFDGAIRIRQRCMVCGSDVDATVADTGTLQEVAGEIGTRVRIAYGKHRCPPVEQSLLGATYEDLEEMFAACERDGTRLAEHAAEIDRLRKARNA